MKLFASFVVLTTFSLPVAAVAAQFVVPNNVPVLQDQETAPASGSGLVFRPGIRHGPSLSPAVKQGLLGKALKLNPASISVLNSNVLTPDHPFQPGVGSLNFVQASEVLTEPPAVVRFPGSVSSSVETFIRGQANQTYLVDMRVVPSQVGQQFVIKWRGQPENFSFQTTTPQDLIVVIKTGPSGKLDTLLYSGDANWQFISCEITAAQTN